MRTARSVSEILDEIRRIKKLKTDAALGKIFGVGQSTVSSWRVRDSFPYREIITFCLNEKISIDCLFIKNGLIKIIGRPKEDSFGHPYIYEVDDLVAKRLTKEMGTRTVEWLATETHIEKLRIEEFLRSGSTPTIEEFEVIASALNIHPACLARSPHPSDNWMYEYYDKNTTGYIPAELYKLYTIEADKFINQIEGYLCLTPELKADVIITACRVHMKETPESSKEANIELIRFLIMLAKCSPDKDIKAINNTDRE